MASFHSLTQSVSILLLSLHVDVSHHRTMESLPFLLPPKTDWEMRNLLKQNSNIVTSFMEGKNYRVVGSDEEDGGSSRTSLKKTFTATVLDEIPYVLNIIAPSMRNVTFTLLLPVEKEKVLELDYMCTCFVIGVCHVISVPTLLLLYCRCSMP